MTKIRKSLIALFGTVLIAGAACAHDHDDHAIGIIDIQKVFATSKHGAQEIDKQLNQEFATKKDQISTQMKTLQAHGSEFEKNRSTMSKTTVEKKESELKQEALAAQKAQNDFQKTFLDAQQTKVQNLMNLIKSYAAKRAQSQHLSEVFLSGMVLYAKDLKDLTDLVITDIDAR